MVRILIIILLFSSLTLQGQKIDFNNFSEHRMNEVLFNEMNNYYKSSHNEDSLILSSFVQRKIMRINRNYIIKRKEQPEDSLYNPKWDYVIKDDSYRDRINSEIFSKYEINKLLSENDHISFAEFIHKSQAGNDGPAITYQKIARDFIGYWTNPEDPDYEGNKFLMIGKVAGICSYFDKINKTIIISFAFIN